MVVSHANSKRQSNKNVKHDPFNENNYHDNIMPHFGTVFGISENAIAIILAEIGCLTLQKSGRTTVRKKGWEDIAGEFDLKYVLEVEMTRLGG